MLFILLSFVPSTSNPLPEAKAPKEEVLTSRRTRVDLSESKPKNSNQPRSKKQHKPQWFCKFCGGVGHTCPKCFKLQGLKQATKQKMSLP